MSEMIERVARAHWEQRRTGFSIPRMGIREIMDWHELPETTRVDERRYARAAIEAMREPTPKMAAAACNALKRHVDSFSEDEREARWPGRKDDKGWRVPNKEKHAVRYTAMIEAALKPEVQA